MRTWREMVQFQGYDHPAEPQPDAEFIIAARSGFIPGPPEGGG